jgi:hypothetical protein
MPRHVFRAPGEDSFCLARAALSGLQAFDDTITFEQGDVWSWRQAASAKRVGEVDSSVLRVPNQLVLRQPMGVSLPPPFAPLTIASVEVNGWEDDTHDSGADSLRGFMPIFVDAFSCCLRLEAATHRELRRRGSYDRL